MASVRRNTRGPRAGRGAMRGACGDRGETKLPHEGRHCAGQSRRCGDRPQARAAAAPAVRRRVRNRARQFPGVRPRPGQRLAQRRLRRAVDHGGGAGGGRGARLRTRHRALDGRREAGHRRERQVGAARVAAGGGRGPDGGRTAGRRRRVVERGGRRRRRPHHQHRGPVRLGAAGGPRGGAALERGLPRGRGGRPARPVHRERERPDPLIRPAPGRRVAPALPGVRRAAARGAAGPAPARPASRHAFGTAPGRHRQAASGGDGAELRAG
ncbi:hypothetical protein SCOCK_80095 [Actinacidiphila cocklensis]|uniref:Uncharacterized protein n=1 Tax=Actinacidiphila cocklensis TaxID=887465 RepID=A0A9W4DWK0_9ACTN|nr:hypothetical protein SCOCK_80095 [Actinacidiphila cocklensis]